MFFEFDDYDLMKAKIKVVGVGGAGGNAINRMIEDNLAGVEFIAVNTDAQDLDNNLAEVKIQIGKSLTKGLGAGADLDVGRQAAEEDIEIIEKAITGADMVFITAGMGGGTGSGAAPRIAQLGRDLGTLTVGIVSRPFIFEGQHRARRSEIGIDELKTNCDTLLVIPNDTLMRITDTHTTLAEALKLGDSILHQATRGISDLINIHGLINLDFADVRTVMHNMGDAIMGTGIAHGEERAILAAQQAISSPLLQDTNITGAKGLLVNVTGDPTLTLHEVHDAASIINDEAGEYANVIFGAVIDPRMDDEFRVTVIATGFSQHPPIGTKDGSFLEKDLASISKLNTEHRMTATDSLSIQNKDGIKGTEPMKAEDNESDEILVFGDDFEIPAVLRTRYPQ